MLRAPVIALALAGLTVLTLGVIDAVPLVYWGSHEEVAAVAHGRATIRAAAALILVAAAASAALGRRGAAALLVLALALPAAFVVLADGTAFGLFALLPGLAAGAVACWRLARA
jgi:hypothetical protein